MQGQEYYGPKEQDAYEAPNEIISAQHDLFYDVAVGM